MTKKVARLYQQFQPENYQLELTPDKDKVTFSGLVTITGRKVGKPSKRITFHQKGLKFKTASVVKYDKKGQEAEEILISRINSHSKFDEVRIHAKDILYPGKYGIKIEFSGQITDQMHGIYPCYFENRQKKLIATQFESHHAREAFPCIDEPQAKATFDLSLIVPVGETVLGNTPIRYQKAKGKLQKVTFQTTPLMSTYLLAFAFGELSYKEAKTKNGVTVRSYATPQHAKLLDFSVGVAVKCIDFFEDYFATPYPLSKLDMIALPDFSAGAMENWGLITYRESIMLVDPKSTSIETKQYVAMVVAHELAHQWFGNLVTMEWWDDIWLNESFATLIEYRAVDELFPEWKIWEQFVNRETGNALRRDALPNVQPIRTEVRHPDELAALFDPSIVYAKGAAVLNMVRHLIGEEVFKKGLKIYFDRHRYSNTKAKDLWQALGEACDINIGEFIDNWLNKPGFPVVDVKFSPSGKNFSASQKRLVIGPGKNDSTIWQVPLSPTLSAKPDLLTEANQGFSLDRTDKGGPLLINHDGHSYFVAHYLNTDHFESILQAISDNKVNTLDRIQLLQHNSLMERAGIVKTVDNLKLAAAYRQESEEVVWSAIGAILGDARRLVIGEEQFEAPLRIFSGDLVRPLINRLGWQTKAKDSTQDLRLRDLALSIGAVSQIPEVLNEAQKRFKTFSKPSDLSPDIRGTVYYVAARFGSGADFEKLLKLHNSLENADERDEVAAALTATKESAQIKKLLDMITTDEVRLQDALTWFAWLFNNYYARPHAWQWLKANWSWVEKNYAEDKSYDRFPRYAASALSTSKEQKMYQDFFGPKQKILALERPIKLGLEEIEGRVKWRQANEKEVKAWLKGLSK